MDIVTKQHREVLNSQQTARVKTLIWDFPTRIFHWTLALAFLVAAVSSEDQWLKLHVLAGYLIAGLLVSRLLWGFAGGYYSRFSQFSYSLDTVKTYLLALLEGRQKHYLSHNPAGSWSVMILLIGCAIVVFGGLLLLGGEEQHGVAQSLNPLVGNMARWLHIIIGNLLIGFVFIHIAGVLIDSRLTGVNLIKSMLDGYKDAPAGSISVKPAHIAGIFLFLLTATVAGGLVVVGGAADLNPLASFQNKSLQQSSLWNNNCGECHMAWHPSLLPARSWKQLFKDQHQHFDEDLFLDDHEADRLLKFALANSADYGLTEAARKINAGIDPTDTPLRITDTSYWKDKHDEIGGDVWRRKSVRNKSNCSACHRDARQGWFDDNAMGIPE